MPLREVAAYCQQTELFATMGRLVEADQAARSALARARQSDDRKLEAAGLLALARTYWRYGDLANTVQNADAARALHDTVDDPSGLVDVLRLQAAIRQHSGQDAATVRGLLEQALSILEKLGEIPRQGNVLNSIALTHQDLALLRAYEERALAIYRRTGEILSAALVSNNLALVYWQLGLYHKAREMAEEPVDLARAARAQNYLATFLDSLARCQAALGQYGAARDSFEEGLALTRVIGNEFLQAAFLEGMGRAAIEGGNPEEAVADLELASARLEQIGAATELPGTVAWLGGAHLALGHLEDADRYTTDAVRRLAGLQGITTEYPPQEVYWWHYHVLLARMRLSVGDDAGQTTSRQLRDEAWSMLEQARSAMMSRIDTLSDEGLRRNYLNKIPINRAIVLEWVRQSGARGVAPDADAGPRAGNVQDQLRRLMEIAVRMNEQHDPAALREFILDEAVELNGAEQVALALLDDDGHVTEWFRRGSSEDNLLAPLGTAPERATNEQQPPELLLSLLPGVFETHRSILHAPEGDDPWAIAVPLLAGEDGRAAVRREPAGLRALRRDRPRSAFGLRQSGGHCAG